MFKCNCISTFAVCQNDHTHYNADAGITDYTSARFCVMHRLALNQYTYSGDVGMLRLQGYSAY